ncbi:HAD family hydrolase [Streptomyces aureus]
MLRATVFDLDDTLIDTGRAWERVCADFTARHGHVWRPQDGIALHGNGHWASYVADLCGGAVETAEVVETCTRVMAENCAAGRIRALPGAVELFREAGRHGPVAVATASPRLFVLAALQHLGLASGVTAVVCGEDVARVKPAPDPYLYAAAALGLSPSCCLAVEDSPNGIRSAAAAGMPVLAIPRDGMHLPADLARLPLARARDAVHALPTLIRLFGRRPEPALPGRRSDAIG